MYRKTLPFAAALAIIFAAAAIAQEEVAPEDIFLKAEKFRLSNDDAYEILVTEVFKGDIGEREVYTSPAPVRAGTPVVDVMGNKFDAPATDSWVYFVDEVPAANWSHPAKIIYVDATNGALSVIECQLPLKMLPEFEGITEAAAKETARLKSLKPIDDGGIGDDEPGTGEPSPSYPFGGKSKYGKYHVLISGGFYWGDNYEYWLNNLKFIYYTLLDPYKGNTDDNIYVLNADGGSIDLDGDGDNDVDYAAKEATVTGVFNTLAANLGKDDELFVYVNTNGNYVKTNGFVSKHCYIYLYNDPVCLDPDYMEKITDEEFAGLINNIQAGKMKFVFGQPFSGGMIDDLALLSGKNIVVATACDYDEFSHKAVYPPGMNEDGYCEFVYWWTVAMHGDYPPPSLPGTHPTSPDPKAADTNNDDKVSLREAFVFARENDRWVPEFENPQYYSSDADFDKWTLCTTTDCGCGSSTKGEAAALAGLFFSSYAIVLIRRRRSRS